MSATVWGRLGTNSNRNSMDRTRSEEGDFSRTDQRRIRERGTAMANILRGALRLEPVRTVTSRGITEPGPPSGGGGDANYYNKLITLFPAEALTLYGTGVAVFGRSTLAALVVCLVVLVLLRSVATQPQQGGPPHYEAVVVAAIS